MSKKIKPKYRVVRQLNDRDTTLMLIRCGLTRDQVFALLLPSQIKHHFDAAASIYVNYVGFLLARNFLKRLTNSL